MQSCVLSHRLYSGFTSGPTNSPGFNPGSTVAFSCHVPSIFTSLGQIVGLSLNSVPLTPLKCPYWLFCRMHLIGLADICWITELSSVVLVIAHPQGLVPAPRPGITVEDTGCWYDLSLVMWTLNTWLWWCLPGFPSYCLTFYIKKYLLGRYFATMWITWFSSHFLSLTSLDDSCLQHLLLWCLPNSDFLFLSFFVHLLVGILL